MMLCRCCARAVRSRILRGNPRGQTATEFAMVAPLALTLLFAIIVFGLAINAYNFATNSARDAVRYAIVHGGSSLSPATSTDIRNLVFGEAKSIDTNNLKVTTTWTPSNQPGSTVKVQVTYAFQPLYPLSNVSLSLTGTSQMIISQ